MALQRTEEFKRDVVRIALTSGLTRRQTSSWFRDWHVDPKQMDQYFSKSVRRQSFQGSEQMQTNVVNGPAITVWCGADKCLILALFKNNGFVKYV